jgi:hypothetical protein
MKKPNGYWTKERILAEAKKYKSKSEWSKKSPHSYYAARKSKQFFKQITRDMGRPPHHNKIWTKASLLEEARKYGSIRDWRLNHQSSYLTSTRSPWHKEICSELKRILSEPWSKEAILEEAAKFQTRTEWSIKSAGSYHRACALGILQEASIHMKFSTTTSRQERELIRHIRNSIPSAKAKYFTNKDPNIPAKRFQLDIYIPELRKGIEFNGTYWHGKGFKRTWTDCPQTYHETKRDFFSSIGIEYLEIWERDWKEDKESCIKKCFDFLGVQKPS